MRMRGVWLGLALVVGMLWTARAMMVVPLKRKAPSVEIRNPQTGEPLLTLGGSTTTTTTSVPSGMHSSATLRKFATYLTPWLDMAREAIGPMAAYGEPPLAEIGTNARDILLIRQSPDSPEPLVVLHSDGTVIFGKDYIPSKAARVFWKALGRGYAEPKAPLGWKCHPVRQPRT